MSQTELPRVYELRTLIADPCNPDAYFQNFDASLLDEPLKKKVWLARERELQCLDANSWSQLKAEAQPHLTKRDGSGRGWQQLIAILNQARGHNFLTNLGCSGVQFIPRANQLGRRTPDLEAKLDGRQILCEVKTFWESEEEIARRRNGGVGTTTDCLSLEFLKKLSAVLLDAKEQLCAHNGSFNTRWFAFIVPNFDDSLAEYKAKYFLQIDQFLSKNPEPKLEIVFFNQWTGFQVEVAMQNAVVINEAG